MWSLARMESRSGIDKLDKLDKITGVEVRITSEAQAQYLRLPKPIAARVRHVTARLARWPAVSGVKPLRREWQGHFRIRSGDWRIIFRPSGDVVWIVRIDNRKDVYEV